MLYEVITGKTELLGVMVLVGRHFEKGLAKLRREVLMARHDTVDFRDVLFDGGAFGKEDVHRKPPAGQPFYVSYNFV